MLRLLAANMREVTGVTPHRLVLYSAHYPLLLGLFGALRLGDNAALRSGSFPSYASALLLELHEVKVAENSVSGAQHRHVVRLLWREGSDAGMTVAGQLTPLVLPGCQQDTMPLGNDAEPGAMGCNLERFSDLISSGTSWCTTCNNTSARTCRASAGAGGDFANADSGISAGAGTALFIVGALLGAFLATWYLRTRAFKETYGAPVIPVTATADNMGNGGGEPSFAASSVVALPGGRAGAMTTV